MWLVFSSRVSSDLLSADWTEHEFPLCITWWGEQRHFFPRLLFSLGACFWFQGFRFQSFVKCRVSFSLFVWLEVSPGWGTQADSPACCAVVFLCQALYLSSCKNTSVCLLPIQPGLLFVTTKDVMFTSEASPPFQTLLATVTHNGCIWNDEYGFLSHLQQEDDAGSSSPLC